MNVTPEARADAGLARSARASSVILGRQDYVSTLLRLIGMELYKIRRRVMSKVLSLLAILATIGLFAMIAMIAFLMSRSGASADAINNFSEAVRLPGSLTWTGQLLSTLGQVLVIILVSTIVGGEYTAGTVRLMLTRGPTRTQIFFFLKNSLYIIYLHHGNLFIYIHIVKLKSYINSSIIYLYCLDYKI